MYPSILMASTLFSSSFEASIVIYEERLKPDIDTIKKSNIALPELVSSAKKVVNETFSPDPRSTYTYKMDCDELSLKLDRVMLSMLANAEECGGKSGQRYVASAILACLRQECMVGALEALGTTWLTCLLFIFKTGTGSRFHGSQQGRKSCCDNVIVRDGYTCVLTGFQDLSHRKPRDEFQCSLHCSDILRGTFAEFDHDRRSQSYKSSLISFDILVNFADLSVKTLEDLGANLDDPSNAIMLEWNAYNTFDKFHWCMKKTEKDNEYVVKVFKPGGIMRLPKNNHICFKDHSNDFLSDSILNRQCSIPLPNPQYIAIHSAVAEILHDSGAGRFFDNLLWTYRDDEGCFPAVRSWPEFESLIEEQLVRKSITDMFQSQTNGH